MRPWAVTPGRAVLALGACVALGAGLAVAVMYWQQRRRKGTAEQRALHRGRRRRNCPSSPTSTTSLFSFASESNHDAKGLSDRHAHLASDAVEHAARLIPRRDTHQWAANVIIATSSEDSPADDSSPEPLFDLSELSRARLSPTRMQQRRQQAAIRAALVQRPSEPKMLRPSPRSTHASRLPRHDDERSQGSAASHESTALTPVPVALVANIAVPALAGPSAAPGAASLSNPSAAPTVAPAPPGSSASLMLSSDPHAYDHVEDTHLHVPGPKTGGNNFEAEAARSEASSIEGVSQASGSDAPDSNVLALNTTIQLWIQHVVASLDDPETDGQPTVPLTSLLTDALQECCDTPFAPGDPLKVLTEANFDTKKLQSFFKEKENRKLIARRVCKMLLFNVLTLRSKQDVDGVIRSSVGKFTHAVFGRRKDHAKGLAERIGVPRPQLLQQMEEEHKSVALFEVDGYQTSPQIEWQIVYGQRKHMARGDSSDIYTVFSQAQERMEGAGFEPRMASKTAKALQFEEVLALRLYTGPMYSQYNKVLREGGRGHGQQRYTATIHCIYSGLLKIARATRPTTTYRGVGNLALPRQLYVPRKKSHDVAEGIVELGFMSCTTSIKQALAFTKTCDGSGMNGILLECKASSFQGGAKISWLSQFPNEDEVLFPPLCGLELDGEPKMSDNRLCLSLRVSLSTNSDTLDQVVGKRHLVLMTMLQGFLAELEGENPDNPSLKEFRDHIARVNREKPALYNNDVEFLRAVNDAVTLKQGVANKPGVLRRFSQNLGPVLVLAKQLCTHTGLEPLLRIQSDLEQTDTRTFAQPHFDQQIQLRLRRLRLALSLHPAASQDLQVVENPMSKLPAVLAQSLAETAPDLLVHAALLETTLERQDTGPLTMLSTDLPQGFDPGILAVLGVAMERFDTLPLEPVLKDDLFLRFAVDTDLATQTHNVRLPPLKTLAEAKLAAAILAWSHRQDALTHIKVGGVCLPLAKLQSKTFEEWDLSGKSLDRVGLCFIHAYCKMMDFEIHGLLNVWTNQLDDEAVTELCSLLCSSVGRHVTVLGMGNNQVTEASGQTLMRMLSQRPDMEMLDVRDNPVWGVECISEAFETDLVNALPLTSRIEFGSTGSITRRIIKTCLGDVIRLQTTGHGVSDS
ncbi:uncharacterized protein MONBRDRAFT_38318 [Monosiga brevicollis MX1]|uniref:ADP ribosyltransferase domain-containing protein n=1 Tax=Monosiga brevicollis TaxID=81824 RepID=A9V6Z4_MONBE|nr:uncharacterized protein MONBRDRAFT_38318 [Monosiga brevicollis MX1]EDQ86701.1 predicted protein [Monosiga brevicollis MX1]|eukprot:XP_001748537.1 hypothetical protein [Monosiga brevicollis MX1]